MDGLTLALDSSTYEGTVAVIANGAVVAQEVIAMRGEREERLMPAVARALDAAATAPQNVSRIVCGAGPGSFTSLRIAAAITKGLAMANAVPIFAVPSLALAAVEAGTGTWLVALDAMRGEMYVACYVWDGATLREVRAVEIVASAALPDIAHALGADVVAARPHARAAAPLLNAIVGAGAVDLASWEPNYGRLAEAQVRWEAAHGTPLGS